MSFASDGRGQPSNEQRALYLGAIAFTYAVWESYVEEVAVELMEVAVEELQDHPDRVPEGARMLIEDGATPWELAVSPGWKGLWVSRVNVMTHGDGVSAWGLNTADMNNVNKIFAALGITPVPKRVAAPRRVRALMAHPSNISHTFDRRHAGRHARPQRAGSNTRPGRAHGRDQRQALQEGGHLVGCLRA